MGKVSSDRLLLERISWGGVRRLERFRDDDVNQLTFNFKVETDRLEVLPDGRLRVMSHSHFTDNSGCGDMDFTYYFVKTGE
jgi:hypothetical protein